MLRHPELCNVAAQELEELRSLKPSGRVPFRAGLVGRGRDSTFASGGDKSVSLACDPVGQPFVVMTAGHRRRKPVHGYQAHLATDQEGGLIPDTLVRAF